MPKILAKLDVKIDQLHPNPWNPNAQTERVQEATKESINAFGFIDPVTVRPHPEIKDAYEIIDGEHRWRAAKDFGLDEVAINVVDVNENGAKQLTIILNETRGESDKVDLAVLLAKLAEDLGDDLIIGLPYTDDELDGLLKLADFNFEQFAPRDDPDPDPFDEWSTIHVRVPAAVVSVWERARDQVEESNTPHKLEPIRNGLALELILADWLA